MNGASVVLAIVAGFCFGTGIARHSALAMLGGGALLFLAIILCPAVSP